MKNLYRFLGIILVSFSLLSGCKVLFDVVPTKELNLPIDLKKLVVGPLLDNNKQQILNVSLVSYFSPDTSLKYGVIAFYDSSSAIAFVRDRKIIGGVQPIPLSKTTDVISTTIGYDNSRGQYIFVTPFAYKAKDSVDIYTKQDYSKAFSSKGYVQLKIGPWNYVTNIPDPNLDGKPVLLAVNDNLHLITYKIGSGTIYNYELDNTNHFVQKGKFQNKFSVVNSSISRSINTLTNAYYANNEYRLFVSTYNTRGTAIEPSDGYGSGELVANQEFGYKSFDDPLNVISYYPFVDVQANRVTVIRTIASGSGFITKGYAKTLLPAKTTKTYSTTNINLNYPSFILFNNSDSILVSPFKDPNSIKLFNLRDPSLNYRFNLPPNNFFNPFAYIGSSTLAVSQDDHAYVINNLLNIFKIVIYENQKDKLYATMIYSGWFPARSTYGISTVFSFSGYVWFVVNKNELWKINLDKLNGGPLQIDFNKDVTPIYVIPE